MKALTARQRETLEWIVAYIQTNWRPPTVEEIAHQFRIKRGSAFDVIQALQKKGFLEPGDGSARSVRPTDLAEASDASIDQRLKELAPSSVSISEVSGFTGSIRVSIMHGRNRALFTAVVRGDEMIEAGIFDGDLAVIRQQEDAEDGNIVLMSKGEDVMLRRVFFGDDGTILLCPENVKYEAETISEDAVTIYGRLVAVYRDVG